MMQVYFGHIHMGQLFQVMLADWATRATFYSRFWGVTVNLPHLFSSYYN